MSEVSKFYSNSGAPLKIYYVRSKEKVEIDLLIELPDNKFIAAEVKVTPKPWDDKQHQLIDSLGLNVIEKWILTPTRNSLLPNSKIVEFQNIWIEFDKLWLI